MNQTYECVYESESDNVDSGQPDLSPQLAVGRMLIGDYFGNSQPRAELHERYVLVDMSCRKV
jgi:hypothetical protein